MLSKRLENARIILAVLGLIISIYLATYASLNLPLSCPSGTVVNCEKVLSSVYSKTFGIPNSWYGVLFFLVFLFLTRIKDPFLLLLMSGAGMGFVFYYIYLEYLVGAICLYCTAVHITVAGLFFISLLEIGGEPKETKRAK